MNEPSTWLEALEQERFSTAYLAHSLKAQEREKEKARQVRLQNIQAAQRTRRARELSALLEAYYQAGRYAAGERDHEAEQGNRRVIEREKRGAKLSAK